MKKLHPIKLTDWLQMKGASVRLYHVLHRRAARLTLRQFIHQWPPARLQKEAAGFGRQSRRELFALLLPHLDDARFVAALGSKFAPFVAGLRDPEPERTCVHCGCTDDRACPGGCAWHVKHAATPTGVCTSCWANRCRKSEGGRCDCPGCILDRMMVPDENVAANPRFVWNIGAIQEEYPDMPDQFDAVGTVLWDRQERQPVLTLHAAYQQACCLETTRPGGGPLSDCERWFNSLSNSDLKSENLKPTQRPFYP